MTVRFTVEASGRVGECAVIESSGNAILDDATCRAIARRYRYEPSRDADGTAVPSTVVEEHTWLVHDR
jgi:protein TonB